MKVNAISSADTANLQTSEVGGTSDDNFSSYLNKDSSLDAIFTKASETYGVPKALLEAITKQESDFDPNATSRCGAQGLMQLMPATAAGLGVSNAYDPEQNIMGGAKYISQLLDQYNGNTQLALAAYNAGSNNVAKYGGIPPFEETQNYVVKVMGYYNGGVDVPNVSYSSASTTDSVSDTEEGSASDGLASDLLDQLFSYEDYLRFLNLYTEQMQKEDSQQNQDENEKEEQSPGVYAYQQIHYNNAVLNLLKSSNM